MVDGTTMLRMQKAIDEATFLDTFVEPTTRGITGVAGDKQFLCVFDAGPADEWMDPRTGEMHHVRPLQSAFYHRQSIRGAAYVSYRAFYGEARIIHQVIIWNERRDMIRDWRGVTGLRKEN